MKERKKLRTNIKIAKKDIIKEIREDKSVNNIKKYEAELNAEERRKANLKKFNKMIED